MFAEADQGTIFLDEIGELPLNLQVKLLHVIEDQQVRALGSEQSRKVNVRIIAATNRDLLQMVKDGSFREDLYFRLNVFHVPLPSLQERQEDIPALLEYFIQKEAVKMGVDADIQFSPEARAHLLNYSWPGNVRELQNVVARSLILCENGRVELSDLPQNISLLEGVSKDGLEIVQGTLKEILQAFEVKVIKKAIEDADGDRKVAASQLGIGISSLYRKLEGDVSEHKKQVES